MLHSKLLKLRVAWKKEASHLGKIEKAMSDYELHMQKIQELQYQKGRCDACKELLDKIVEAAVLYNNGKVTDAIAAVAKHCQELMNDAVTMAQSLDLTKPEGE